MVFVDRGNPGQAYQNLEAAARRIKGGISIIAYPEGTRSTDGTIKPFKRGPFVTAIKAGVPVVPVAIEGSGVVLPRGGFRLRPGLIRLRIGEPIATAALEEADVAQLVAQARQRMIELHRSIGGAGARVEATLDPTLPGVLPGGVG
jgi:1-acyl-sn-glycerol-3-phosphate acyltransferase